MAKNETETGKTEDSGTIEKGEGTVEGEMKELDGEREKKEEEATLEVSDDKDADKNNGNATGAVATGGKWFSNPYVYAAGAGLGFLFFFFILWKRRKKEEEEKNKQGTN